MMHYYDIQFSAHALNVPLTLIHTCFDHTLHWLPPYLTTCRTAGQL